MGVRGKIHFKIFINLFLSVKSTINVWIHGLVEVLGWKSNEWVANTLGPGQTSALQIKTRFLIIK